MGCGDDVKMVAVQCCCNLEQLCDDVKAMVDTFDSQQRSHGF